jgi:hypothetical protein
LKRLTSAGAVAIVAAAGLATASFVIDDTSLTAS